jgi:NAD(P)-dependent dehydrogenase (short-subunit alcohol dehydrogenase family)
MAEALLAGKVAVVTGGAAGIGQAICLRFASAGATVVVVDVDEPRTAATVAAIADAGGEASGVLADVTDVDSIAAVVSEAGDRADILVNNVGHHLFGRHDFVDSTEDEWEALHDVNLRHVLRCTRALLPGMLARGRGGSIVNLTTVEAHRGIPQHAVYSAYKAAVEAFTRSLALEVGDHGVRVNSIAPDLTESQQVRYSEWVPPEQLELLPTWVPLARFGTPDDIAGVALFLASVLSVFVTGTPVHADGGSLAAGGWFRTPAGGWTNRPLQRG